MCRGVAGRGHRLASRGLLWPPVASQGRFCFGYFCSLCTNYVPNMFQLWPKYVPSIWTMYFESFSNYAPNIFQLCANYVPMIAPFTFVYCPNTFNFIQFVFQSFQLSDQSIWFIFIAAQLNSHWCSHCRTIYLAFMYPCGNHLSPIYVPIIGLFMSHLCFHARTI